MLTAEAAYSYMLTTDASHSEEKESSIIIAVTVSEQLHIADNNRIVQFHSNNPIAVYYFRQNNSQTQKTQKPARINHQ
jgi:hypothetical protein